MSNRTIANYDFREDGMYFNGELAGSLDSEGYRMVWADGKYHKAHRLIYEHFYLPVPKGYDVHHIDGNPLNNRSENLWACSRKEHFALDQRRAYTSQEARAKNSAAVSAARMGKQQGLGPHPTQLSSGKWLAKLKYHLREFYFGLFDTETVAQAVLDKARAFVDTQPALEVFAEWAKARSITKKR